VRKLYKGGILDFDDGKKIGTRRQARRLLDLLVANPLEMSELVRIEIKRKELCELFNKEADEMLLRHIGRVCRANFQFAL
jgi:hypothetical protein